MKQVMIDPCGLPEELKEGLAELCRWEGFVCRSGGIRVRAQRGSRFCVEREENELRVEYSRPVQFFRALSCLKEEPGARRLPDRPPVFRDNGVMLDCSRNAVLRSETVRLILRKMALMGLSVLMLYTEDTYEVDQMPYFGYLRGRYSREELRELDACAASLGIELIPCVQTLAHLERALHWPQVDPRVRDTEDILMVDEPATYEMIDRMIGALRQAFRSRRIHIGMDEAWMLGLGNYRLKHGFVPAYQLMKRHLERVRDIARKHGFSPMIWSDMYLCAASPTGSYYDPADPIPDQVRQAVCEDVALVYWDYGHNDQADYERLLRLHRQFPAETVFAGGLWTWIGPAPALDKMAASSVPALRACEKAGVNMVVGTAWGDNGAECSLLTALYGMQLYAEYDYTGRTDAEWIGGRFAVCVGEPAAPFLLMPRFNTPPGIRSRDAMPVNASKFLLYEDPLLPLFARDTQGMRFAAFYEDLADRFRAFSSGDAAFERLYRFYEELARLLALKCRWRESLPGVTRETAAGFSDLAGACIRQIRACRLAWETLWETVNKPYGFEVLDLRLSGLAGRFDTARRKLDALGAGDDAVLALLREEKLRFLSDEAGGFCGIGSWSQCVSACKI